MSGYKVEISGSSIFVTPTNNIRSIRLDELAKKVRGKWWGKDRYYSFPAKAEAALRALLAEIDAPVTRPVTIPAAADEDTQPQPTPHREPQNGNGTDGRTYCRSGGHPLGRQIGKVAGGTVYRDTTFGGTGRVTIYDES